MSRPSTRSAVRVVGVAAGLALIIGSGVLASRAVIGEPARAVLPIATGVAIALMGATWGSVFLQPATWLGVLLVGHAAALRITNAGTSLHYQHLLPLSSILQSELIALVLLVCQTVLVLYSLIRQWPRVARGLRGFLRRWQLVLLVGFLVLSAATVSEDRGFYVRELALAAWLQFVAIGTVICLLLTMPPAALDVVRSSLARMLGTRERTPEPRPHIDAFAGWCAVIVTIVTAGLCLVVYENHPHVQDEVKYLYQARYFAEGRLAMTPPPVPEAFELFLMEVGPRGWFSVVPPGWPAVLASGVVFGVGWLVNPLLSGVNMLLAYLLVWRLYERRTARLSVLLLAVSPWALFLAMSFMAHTLTLTCLLVAALTVERAREGGPWWMTWVGGGLLGLFSLVRQLDALVVSLLLGLWALGLGGRRLKLQATLGLVCGALLIGGLTLPYNYYFTGSPSKFPIMSHTDRLFGKGANDYGFGSNRGMGWPLDPLPGHGPIDATINANLNTTAMNVELFGWPTGSLLLIAVLLVSGRLRGNDWLGVTLAAGIFIAYFFNYFSGGPDFGARYWFLMILPAVVLTARAVTTLANGLRGVTPDAAETRAIAALGALTISSLVCFIPWRAVDKYHGYLDMRPEVPRLAQQHAFGRSLVLVRGREFPDYASAAIYNPLDVHAEAPVYVRHKDAVVTGKILNAYADRPVWIVDGPSRTGSGYRVVAGPLSAAAALDWTEVEQ